MEERTFGERLREIRLWRDLSQREAAELAGFSASYVSLLERDERTVERRSTLEALAGALRIAPSELTGQPFAPVDAGQAAGHAAASPLRAVLRDIELGEIPHLGPRPLEQLRAEVARVDAASGACEYGILGEIVPSLIAELHVAAAAGSGEARRLLGHVLNAAFYLAKDLGREDLAWMVAGHLHATAEAISDPQWIGLAQFVRAHGTLGGGARQRSLSLSERAADAIPLDDGEAGQVHGMLHLSAALNAAALYRREDAMAHLEQAHEVAKITGNGDFAGLQFGPRNVGVWRIAIAVELGEGGRVRELARGVDVDAITRPGRRAMFHADYGRGLAAERSTRDQAVTALRTAEDIAPQLVRANFYVRETVSALLARARRDAGGRELRGLAYRMGLFR